MEFQVKVITHLFLASVKFCTVSEAGASVYSVGKVGQLEFPSLLPEFRLCANMGKRRMY